MESVETAVADVLFSGQNIEHLWQEEILGFLLEAHRVLKIGGLLVIDSPNRLVTALYGAAHPEHMIEFTPKEAETLLTLAGFDVASVRGELLCRERRSGLLLASNVAHVASEAEIAERSLCGLTDPDNAYAWWIQAQRVDRTPDVNALRDAIAACWAIAWPERMGRILSDIGAPVQVDGRPAFEGAPGGAGALFYGPYAPALAGLYRATIQVRLLSDVPSGAILGFADVIVGEDDADPKARRELRAGDLSREVDTPVTLDFELKRFAFGLQARLFTNGLAGMRVMKAVEISRRGDVSMTAQAEPSSI